MRKVLLLILFCFSILLSPSTGFPFKVYFNSAKLVSSDKILFSNIRLYDPNNPDTLEDSISAIFKFDINTLNFNLDTSSVKYFSKIGIFSDWLMAKDVDPKQPTYKVDNTEYQCGHPESFISSKNDPFIAHLFLEPGHVICWNMSNQSCNYKVTFFKANDPNDIIADHLGESNQGIISFPHNILEPGEYLLKIEPFECNSMSFRLLLFNANNRILTELHNGDYISETFRINTRDYAKFKIFLRKGEVLKLKKPNSDIALKLINRYSQIEADVRGLPLIYQAEETGYYYLFIYNAKGWGGNYNGPVEIYTKED